MNHNSIQRYLMNWSTDGYVGNANFTDLIRKHRVCVGGGSVCLCVYTCVVALGVVFCVSSLNRHLVVIPNSTDDD